MIVRDPLDTKRRMEGAAFTSGGVPVFTASGLRLYDHAGHLQFFRPAVTEAGLCQLEAVAAELGSERSGGDTFNPPTK